MESKELEKNSIEHSLAMLGATRANFFKYLNKVELDELNVIKAPFNNSIGWNIAHSVVTFYLFAYKLTGNEVPLDQFWLDYYTKASDGKQVLTEDRLNELKMLCVDSTGTFMNDYHEGLFQEFKEYETSYGVKLTSLEEAIAFNNLHESLHLGYVMAQYRANFK